VRVIDQLAVNDPAKALVLLEGVDAAIDDGQLHRDLVGRSAHPLFGGGDADVDRFWIFALASVCYGWR